MALAGGIDVSIRAHAGSFVLDAAFQTGAGATAILVGRAYVWGLAAFGQVGVQRVVEMLHGEFEVSMGLAGMPDLASISRDLVRLPWEQ